MEKLNIAELLKDCPQGMELDCSIWDNVVFDHIDTTSNYPIYIKKMGGELEYLTEDGHFNFDCDAKCVIFPKGKTTWEGFQRPFEDGDVVAVTMFPEGIWIGIFKQYKETETEFESYCCLNVVGEFCSTGFKNHSLIGLRLATEEEKEKLFKAIKDNGYKWNEETKTLEKLVKPRFKVGDRIRNNQVDLGNIYTIIEVRESSYVVNKNNEHNNYNIDFVLQDDWELVPSKFDISNLKPFDKVLVRCGNNGLWNPQFFAKYRPHSKFPFTCTYNSWSQCVPYEGNEHLLDTTDDCDEFYKNW